MFRECNKKVAGSNNWQRFSGEEIRHFEMCAECWQVPAAGKNPPKFDAYSEVMASHSRTSERS